MMHSPLTAFYDKTPDGDGHWSMTRVTAFLFALCYLTAMMIFAFRAKELNWPFAVLGVVVLLAVPLQSLFSFLGQWISSKEGRDLLTTAIHKVEESLMPGAPTKPAPQPTVNVSATVSPGEKG